MTTETNVLNNEIEGDNGEVLENTQAPAAIDPSMFMEMFSQFQQFMANNGQAAPAPIDPAMAAVANLEARERQVAKEQLMSAVSDKIGPDHLEKALEFAKSSLTTKELDELDSALLAGGYAGQALLDKVVADYKASEVYAEEDARLSGQVRVGSVVMDRMEPRELAGKIQAALKAKNHNEVARLRAIAKAM